MSTIAPDFLTFADLASMIEQAVRDKSYRSTPLGLYVGRYIRWCRNERNLVEETTLRDYEGTLARMAVTLSRREPEDVTIEDLRTVVDLWAGREANTRRKVISTIRGFWKWIEDEGIVERSPATRLRTPRRPKKAIGLLGEVDTHLLAAAETARDRLALLVLLDCGLRRSELTAIMARDFDLRERRLTVFGKGQKHRILPLRGRIVPAIDEYLLTELREPVGRRPRPDDYLLYSEHRNRHGIYRADPALRMPGQTAHHWWYRHLQAAGLVEKDVERGMNMHRARHTFATELRRTPGVDLGDVQHMLGHEDIHTTEAYYGHYDLTDLERAMDAFARERR